MQEDKLIRCLSISLSFRLLQTTFFPIIGICKLFSCNANQHMLFWLLKDAWLTCNWCSVRALPMPFWSPIKHLLKLAWQPIGLLLVADLLFCTCFLYLQMIYLKLCNDFSKSYLYSQRMKMKRSLYRRMITGWTADVDARHRTCCWQTCLPSVAWTGTACGKSQGAMRFIGWGEACFPKADEGLPVERRLRIEIHDI